MYIRTSRVILGQNIGPDPLDVKQGKPRASSIS